MEVLYINRPGDAEKIDAFNEYWGITQLCDGKTAFLWQGREYRFDCQHCEPTITMKCVDDGGHITFGVSSDLKAEFIPINEANG